eukprot:TRINITY_DN44873_c0_g2_i3.p1 TRINITY_DN44873_c0_g2~~TRINITY_DN44873_c0_g2_i3.p1  ORF type:complete len:113 (-),score=12.83 TRINITY_DN44873_c0_g2_i3:76-414(-)
MQQVDEIKVQLIPKEQKSGLTPIPQLNTLFSRMSLFVHPCKSPKAIVTMESQDLSQEKDPSFDQDQALEQKVAEEKVASKSVQEEDFTFAHELDKNIEENTQNQQIKEMNRM